MRFLNKPRKPTAVIVIYKTVNKITHEIDEVAKQTIIIPDGATFKHRFAQQPQLINRYGEIVEEFDWEPGYEVDYKFLY